MPQPLHNVARETPAQFICDPVAKEACLKSAFKGQVLHNVARGADPSWGTLHSVAGGESSEVLHNASSGALAHD
jgi:hypothetical protein